MAIIVVEALVSASVELLLDKIVSGELVDFFRSTKLDVSLLERLKITLLSLQAVLNDAEEKQITNHAVKEWLVMLQDVVFDAEDLFDEINTEALRCRVKAEHEGKTAKVLKFLSSRFKRSYDTINSKMQTLFERLKHFSNEAHLLGLREGVSSSAWHGTPTSSVAVDESSIYGRDSDKEKLKDFLLSENASECGSKIGVISIVGMGGLGKTTLAKLLYNDPEVKRKFNLKAWVHISKDFDIVKVTKALLESITSKTTEANNLDTLQVKLQQSLRGEIFLLVLDDIWDVSYVDWNSLKDIFNVGETGSKIIITTRDERVALTMQTFLPIHKLTPLKSDESWSLLAKHAFGPSNYQQSSNLEKIGREIAEKCDGLPLAAIALGGLLRTKLSIDEWNHVLKSNIWNLIRGTTTEFPTLRRLILRGCPKLKGNIPTNLPSLIGLWLQECLLLVESEKLDDNGNVIIVRPPSQLMLPPLNSLQQLTLDDFPSLKSFPRDGLPKTLLSLRISECENLEFLANESLYSYTSLEKLHIHHSCYSMTSFTLGSLPVLKNLDISGCKNLRSIVLIAEDAPKLKSLPGEGFPSSLLRLQFKDCPLLETSLRSKRGKEWRKIAHIPSIVINGEMIMSFV